MTEWTTPETRIVANWIQNDDWPYASSRHAAHHGRLREHIRDTLRSGITEYFTIDMLEASLNRVDWEQLWALFEEAAG